MAVSQGLSPAFLRQLEPLLATVPEHEEPELYELPEINRLLQGLTRAASLGLLAGVALPLVARNQVIGVLFIFRNYLGVFSPNDKALLQSFADQAAIAVHNAQLYTQVRHEERRITALLDAVADGMLILTADHTIEHCNPALARMLGVSLDEIRGHKHEQVIRWARKKDDLSLEQAEAGGWPLTPNASLYVEGDLERPVGPALAGGDHLCSAGLGGRGIAECHRAGAGYHPFPRSRRAEKHLCFGRQPRAEDAGGPDQRAMSAPCAAKMPAGIARSSRTAWR